MKKMIRIHPATVADRVDFGTRADPAWQARMVRAAIRLYLDLRPGSAEPAQWDRWLADRLAWVTALAEQEEREVRGA